MKAIYEAFGLGGYVNILNLLETRRVTPQQIKTD